MEKEELQAQKKVLKNRKSAAVYYHKHKDEEELKMKNRERYIEKKKEEYITLHGSLEGFIPPKQYKKVQIQCPHCLKLL